MQRLLLVPLFLFIASCFDSTSSNQSKTLLESRANFVTELVDEGEDAGPPDIPPPSSGFELIRYESPEGKLAAYLTVDPGDGNKHPAIVWITGGDNNSIGNIWSGYGRDNDQSASAFRKAGIVMMFPSQRGGNDNPGRREGFLGETDDILAATDHLAELPYVDPDQIYLGGHSTGGTMVLLVAASSDRYKGVFSLGPVGNPAGYGGSFVYCDPYSRKEMRLRSPISWLHCIESPTYVIEGVRDGNLAALKSMNRANKNAKVKFLEVPGHDHFSVIAPVAELIAAQIVKGKVDIDASDMRGLR